MKSGMQIFLRQNNSVRQHCGGLQWKINKNSLFHGESLSVRANKNEFSPFHLNKDSVSVHFLKDRTRRA